MEYQNYDCLGNEAVINDCQINFDSCPSIVDFVSMTELSCKGKKLYFFTF